MHKLDNRVGPRLRRQQGFYNPRELAHVCNITFWTMYDLIEKGAVQRPLHRLAKSVHRPRRFTSQYLGHGAHMMKP